MNLTEFFSQGLALVGTFDARIMAFLFLLCFVGEAFGFFVPYLFEGIWLLIGYQLSLGVLPPTGLLLLLLSSLAGRAAGTLVLYQLCRSGSSLLSRYKNRCETGVNLNESLPLKLFRKTDFLSSPFSVALGRLFWLRIPLTLILAAQRKLKVLLLGVALSSLIYEGIYLTLGAIVGTTAKLEPVRLILYSLAALTVIYLGVFTIRHLFKRLRLETAR